MCEFGGCSSTKTRGRSAVPPEPVAIATAYWALVSPASRYNALRYQLTNIPFLSLFRLSAVAVVSRGSWDPNPFCPLPETRNAPPTSRTFLEPQCYGKGSGFSPPLLSHRRLVGAKRARSVVRLAAPAKRGQNSEESRARRAKRRAAPRGPRCR